MQTQRTASVDIEAGTQRSNGMGNRPSPPSTDGMSAEQYRRLAEFRYQMRRFLHFSQQAASKAGIQPQQYQLLQVIAGIPEEMSPTIAAVASRMCLRHNSAVELVNRTIEANLIRKAPDPVDHRRLLLQITPSGQRLLASLVEFHLRELDEFGPELIRALKRVLSISQINRNEISQINRNDREV
jgi:DNA-binding MarR family transcriptional regulator